MSSSREASPDWLRAFQAPTLVTTLSSESEPLNNKSPSREDTDGEQDDNSDDLTVKQVVSKLSNKKTIKKQTIVADELPIGKKKTGKQKKIEIEDDEDVMKEDFSEKHIETHAPKHSLWTLSSDSDSDSDSKVPTRKKQKNDESTDESLKQVGKDKLYDSETKMTKKGKSPKKRMIIEDVKPTEMKDTSDNVKIEGQPDDEDVPKGKVREKHGDHRVCSSTLPLMFPEKVSLSKSLIECDGESIDVSGDMGAVGRVIISEAPTKEPEMFLDLKGTIYKTTIVPSRTFCVVSIGQSEAKIEAIMNDFVQLTPQSNVYDAETMVEGTLDGFSFDSEDETDKMNKDVKGDKKDGTEEKSNDKPKGRTQKKMGATQKKVKVTGGKTAKKKKPQAAKKGKSKK